MAENEARTAERPRKPSLCGKIFATLFFSLLLGIIIEWLGMAFIWAEERAMHSQQVMTQEFGWFSEGFQQSLLYSQPVLLAEQSIQFVHRWLFVETGIQSWLTTEKTGFALWLYQYTGAYIEASLYVTIIFIIRLFIIVLTLPLFLLAGLVGITDGLVQRDIRRFGIGRESATRYHYAKRSIGPIMLLAWLFYLSVPFSIHPNWVLIPAAILFGFSIRMTASSFKKYL